MASTCIPRHSQPLATLFWGGGDEQQADGTRFNPTVIQFLEDDYVLKKMIERCGGGGGGGLLVRRVRALVLRAPSLTTHPQPRRPTPHPTLPSQGG